jgi:transketolase
MSKITPDQLTLARQRLVKMHYESGVGHLGGNLSALDAMLLVFHEFLSINDQFILSKGHSAGALYIALWSVGKIADSELVLFHKDNTLLAGHPPAKGIPEIPFATGSLGHGLSLAAGTALAFKLKQEKQKVFCITSDGEWQEGSTWEALIFAVHNKLNNLTVLIDHNNLQGFGATSDVASMSPLWEKFQGYQIDLHVVDGHDLAAIRNSIAVPTQLLKIIVLKTIKGKGISFLENRMDSHYLPLSTDQFQTAMQELEAK